MDTKGLASPSPTIEGVSTSVTAFVGYARRGPINQAIHLSNFGEYEHRFGGLQANSEMSYAVQQYFLNGGREAWVVRVPKGAFIGNRTQQKGIYALDQVAHFSVLCLPGVTDLTVLENAAIFCQERYAFLIVDCPPGIPPDEMVNLVSSKHLPDTANAAVYYPWLTIGDPLQNGRTRACAPSGTIAGMYARTDNTRGVWKSPAGADLVLVGVQGITRTLTPREGTLLVGQGINYLRVLPTGGIVAWNARTLQGNDQQSSDWKYIPVRRLALFIEESIMRGMRWVVFEPNNELLWANIRQSIEDFMFTLFKQGALIGNKPDEAYFVRCDRSTMTQADMDSNRVIVVVGFAPLKPSEFTLIRIQQMANSSV